MAEIVQGADKRAEEYRDVLKDVRESGYQSFSAIAQELNRREIEAPRGGRWYPASVARLTARLAQYRPERRSCMKASIDF